MAIQTLIVEDDLDLAGTITEYLALEGIESDHASNGPAGLTMARDRRYDVIVLDVGLPKLNGLEVCHALRCDGTPTPVLMLTARDTLDDKLAGFNAGTDDYVVKPFEFSELVARIRSLAHRRSGQVRRLCVGDLVMDLDQHQVTRAGDPLRLTPIGWKLLESLMRASPSVVSRVELVDMVWGDDPPDTNSLKVHLHRLRQDVDKAYSHAMVTTVPGRGVALRPINGD